MADFSIDSNLSGSVASDVAADVKAAVTLGGLNDINIDSKLASDSKVAATVKSDSAVKTDSSVSSDSKVATTSNVDLAPVAVDSCVRVELGPLPPTQVSTPWEQRFALSVLGMELVAWTVSGRSATTILPVTPPPRVVGSIEQGQVVQHERHDHDDDGPGLHIRLG